MSNVEDLNSGRFVASVMDRIQRDGANLQVAPGVKARKKRLSLQQHMSKGATVMAGHPVEIGNFEGGEDTILFVYSPDQTPNPEFTLRDGPQGNEKHLVMDGEVVVRVANAAALAMSDFAIIEMPLPLD